MAAKLDRMDPFGHKSIPVGKHTRLLLTPELKREMRRYRWRLRWAALKAFFSRLFRRC